MQSVVAQGDYNNRYHQDTTYINQLIGLAEVSCSQNFKRVIELTQEAIHLSKTIGYERGKAEAQLLICKTYNSGLHYDSILTHCMESIVYFKKTDQNLQLAWAYDYTGIIYDILGERKKAMRSFYRGLSLFKASDNEIGIGYCLNDIGVIHSFEGEYVLATDHLYQALEIFEKNNHDLGLLRVYTCLGYFYKRQFQPEKAKKVFLEAMQLAEKTGNRQWKAIALSGYIQLLRKDHKYEEALSYNQQILNLSDTLQSKYVRFDAVKNQAAIQLDLKQYEEAEKYALSALELAIQQNRIKNKADIQNLLADIHLQQKQLVKAKKYLNLAKNNTSITKNSKAKNHALWVNYYEHIGDFNNAFKCQTAFIQLTEELNKQDKNKAIANIEKGYELGKKQGEIDLLNEQNQKQRTLLQERNNLLLAVLLLSFLFSCLFIKLYLYKKKLNKTLELEVAERTKDLINLNKRLENTNEELKRFAFITSHDLKEPLRNIAGFLHLIEKNKSTLDKKETEEYISLAKSNAYQMHELIEDVLEFSQLDSRTEKIQEVDLNKTLDQVVSTMTETINSKKANIKIQSLPALKVASTDMVRLFQNLIENGIKYNQSAKPIIEIECVEKEKEYCIFVKDNGIGIEKEYHDSIFEMFKRLHNRSDYKGSGIGLASCKKIVEKYKGNIHVYSKLNDGTTFIMNFPKASN